MAEIKKWHKLLRRKITPFLSYNFMKGLLVENHFKEILNIDFKYTGYRYINQTVYFPEGDINKGIKIIREKVLKNPKFLETVIRKNLIHCQRLIRASQLKGNLSRWPKERIIQKLKNYSKEYRRTIPFWIAPLWIENIGEDLLKKVLEKKVEDKGKVANYFNALTLSSQLGFPEKEQRDFYKIAALMEKKGMLSSSILRMKKRIIRNTELKERCERYLKKYCWLNIEFTLGEPWNIDNFLERLKGVKNPLQRLKELKEIEQEKKKKFQDVLRKLSFSKNEKRLIFDIRKFVFLRTYRKNIASKAEYLIRPLFNEIAERIDLSSYEDVLYLTTDEIIAVLMNQLKVYKKLIKQRKKDFAGIGNRNSIKIISGKKLEEYKQKWKKITQESFEKGIKEIEGAIAYKGLAKGRVRVILDKEKMKLFKVGEILITSMTTTDFMPILYKAKAIVTDEGGITCHAAITSRELKKPCIIGTKIATKVLKDGDLVEIDANKGVVKILKKAK